MNRRTFLHLSSGVIAATALRPATRFVSTTGVELSSIDDIYCLALSLLPPQFDDNLQALYVPEINYDDLVVHQLDATLLDNTPEGRIIQFDTLSLESGKSRIENAFQHFYIYRVQDAHLPELVFHYDSGQVFRLVAGDTMTISFTSLTLTHS